MKVDQLANQLEKATSLQQAEGFLVFYFAQFNITSLAFTFYSGHVKTGKKLQYDFVSPALKVWHIHYLEQGYADVDRTLEEASHDVLPVYWDVQQQLKQSKNNREKRIRQESIEHGIAQGLSIPIHGTHQDFATLTLHQRINESCLSDYQQHQFEWLGAGLLFYTHIKRLLQLSQNSNKHILTKREEQCLTLTAESWRVEQIAKHLKISMRTVNFHLQNTNKKLGTHNKYQSVNEYYQLVNKKRKKY
jgi:DNA-binding CsgD family transcriptional regulator